MVILHGRDSVYFNTALQKGVTLSITEAEYVSLSDATKVIVWHRRVLEEIGIFQDTTIVHEDNSGTFKWSSGHVAEYFRRCKHVDMRYLHVREEVRDKNILSRKVSTSEMIADFLTKPLKSSGTRNELKKITVGDHDGEEEY